MSDVKRYRNTELTMFVTDETTEANVTTAYVYRASLNESWVKASDYAALEAENAKLQDVLKWKEDEMRELEYALQCSMNFGAAVNARVAELEQSLANARDEAFEEAAKVVEGYPTVASQWTFIDIAKRVRALKSPSSGGENG